MTKPQQGLTSPLVLERHAELLSKLLLKAYDLTTHQSQYTTK